MIAILFNIYRTTKLLISLLIKISNCIIENTKQQASEEPQKEVIEPETELIEEKKEEIIPQEITLPIEKQKKKKSRALNTIGFGVGAAIGALGVIYIINKFLIPTYPKAPKALPGSTKKFKVDEGLISYYQEGEGDPLIIIHSINAGASSHEMEKIFNYYNLKRTVYSLDLLGFGLSDRPNIEYNPELYIKHITEFINHIKLKHEKTPDVICLSLTTEYLVSIAEKNSELINKLILISPTGLENKVTKVKYGMNKATLTMLKLPIIGQGLFNVISSKLFTKKYLSNRIFVEPKNLSYIMLQQYYYTSHVKGAKNAPSYFVAGELFINNIFQKYLNLKTPSLIIKSSLPKSNKLYAAMDYILRDNEYVKEKTIKNGGLLPYIEKPEEFFSISDKFLDQ